MKGTSFYLIALLTGYGLDLCFGTSRCTYLSANWINQVIFILEKSICNHFTRIEKKEAFVKGILAILIISILGMIGASILVIADWIHPVVSFLAAVLISCQMLGNRLLQDQSKQVYQELKIGKSKEKIEQYKKEKAIQEMIETVAKGISEDVIAPLFYMALFGPIGGIIYQAGNRISFMEVKLNEIINYIPSRLAAGLMIIACAFLQFPVKETYRIFLRDRYICEDINSGQTRAVCAGALGIQLMEMGDAKRKATCEDILSVNRILSVSSYLGLVLLTLGCWAVRKLFGID